MTGIDVCHTYNGVKDDVNPEMEKRADGADASVLFFLLGCANFLAVYAQIRKTSQELRNCPI